MSKRTTLPLPALERILRELGENIKLARLRRRFSTTLIAERAGMDRKTLRRVEHGDPATTLGAYANVLQSLGLESDISLIARDDLLGRKIQDAALTTKKRAPRRSDSPSVEKAIIHGKK